MTYLRSRQAALMSSGGFGLLSAAGEIYIQEAYLVRERPRGCQCPECGAAIEKERFGKRHLWRCTANSDHTGCWEDSTELNAMRNQQGLVGRDVTPGCIRDRVLHSLACGPLNTVEITEATGLTQRTVSPTLTQLRDKGLIRCTGRVRAGRLNRPTSVWELVK